jgi:hypothetical protein
MCRCEQRRRREGPVDREDDRFASPEVFKHVGDAAGHCSMFGISSAVTGSNAPVPGWSKKISRPSVVIASTQS